MTTSGGGSYQTVVAEQEGNPPARCGQQMVKLSATHPEYRAEITPTPAHTMAYGAKGVKEATYLLSLYLGEAHPDDQAPMTIAQWHTWSYRTKEGAEAWAPPDVELVLKRDTLTIYIRTYKQLMSSLPEEEMVEIPTIVKKTSLGEVLQKNQWNDIVLQARWSYHLAAASLALTINGDKLFQHNGPNSIRVPTDAPPYFKAGVYMWDWKGKAGLEPPQQRTLWINEVYIIPAIVIPDLYRSCE